MSAPEAHDPSDDGSIGKKLGDWVVAKPLAAGGMGSLYLAARPSASTGVELAAVKQLLAHLCWDPEFVRMFLEEVRIVSGLNHPNIVRVVDWGTGSGGHYFVMEYVHGENLDKLLRALEGRRPPLELAVGIVAELADGLHYAHEYQSPDGAVHGVVHRDVSPSNVMIGYEGRVRLLDFGIARISGHTRHTKTGSFKGKIGYMSPEQCRGTTVDRRTDVFSLGILLYELSLGRRAFFGGSDFAVVAKILEGQYDAPARVDPYFPPALAAIIERALHPDPEQRYATAAEVASSLRAYAQGCGLDLNPHLRAHWMHSLFASRPRPTVDLVGLQRGLMAQQRGRARAKLRTAVAIAAALGLGAVGFVAGTMSGGPTPARGVPESSDPIAGTIATPESAARAYAPAPTLDGQPVLPELEPEAELAVVPSAQGDGSTESAAADDPEDDQVVIEEDPVETERRPRRRKPAANVGPAVEELGKGATLLPPSWQ